MILRNLFKMEDGQLGTKMKISKLRSNRVIVSSVYLDLNLMSRIVNRVEVTMKKEVVMMIKMMILILMRTRI